MIWSYHLPPTHARTRNRKSLAGTTAGSRGRHDKIINKSDARQPPDDFRCLREVGEMSTWQLILAWKKRKRRAAGNLWLLVSGKKQARLGRKRGQRTKKSLSAVRWAVGCAGHIQVINIKGRVVRSSK